MIRNMGSADRVFRILIGLVLIAAPLLNLPNVWSNGILAWASMIIGAVLVLTSIFGLCPLYSLFGLSTRRHG